MMRWTGHVVHMGEKTKAYRDLVKKPERKRLLKTPMSRMEGSTEINCTEIG